MTEGAARRLPNSDRVIVELRRSREYLLNLAHAAGGPKAKFTVAHGFAPDTWDSLQAALIIQSRANPVTRIVGTRWGTRYTVECSRPTPDERNPCIRTIWQMEDDAPRLLTAIPL